jgi:hypothetical protein
MKPRTKWILMAGAVFVIVPALAVTVFVVAAGMALSGTWPFEELDRRTRYIEPSSLGRIRIEGVEDRGWGSNGYIWTASFQQHGTTDFLRIGSWVGESDDLRVYTPGKLIVCSSPDRRTIHVFDQDGVWRFFDLRLPGKNENFEEFSRFTPALREADLQRFQSELTEAEAAYSPTTEIQSFDPITMEFRARVLTSRIREVTFSLSADGQSVHLQSIRSVD